MADAGKAAKEHMHRKAANELVRRETHDPAVPLKTVDEHIKPKHGEPISKSNRNLNTKSDDRMQDKLRHFVRRVIRKVQIHFGLERLLILTGQTRIAEIRRAPRLASLAEAEVPVFSQWGEDGVIDWIIEKFAITNDTFVEFGVEDFSEANCRFLLVNRHWRGFLIDANPYLEAALINGLQSVRYDLSCCNAFVNKDNINGLIAKSGFGKRLGLLSVDIDGADYWVLEAIEYEADIIIVEYNDFLGPLPVSVPYKEKFVRHSAHYSGVYWGASLSAFRSLLEKRGYVFLGTNRAGTNAFFVHSDHAHKVDDFLYERKAYPPALRDTRDANGKLTRLPYQAMLEEVSSLPLIDVETGEALPLRAALAPKQ